MTNRDKKAFLAQYIPALSEVRRLEEEIEVWRARAEKMVQSGGRMSGGGEGRALENAVAQIDLLTARLAEQAAVAARVRNAIQRAIGTVDDRRLRWLLELRYVDGLSWDDVAKKLGYEVRQVFRLHGIALNVIECQ